MRTGAITFGVALVLNASVWSAPPKPRRAATEIGRLELSCEQGNVGGCLASGQLGRAALLHLRDAGLASSLDRATTPLQKAAALAEYVLAVRQKQFEAGLGPPEHVYLWSKRLLRNRLALAPDQAAQALEGHAAAMGQLERAALRPAGPFADPLARMAPDFFRAEAECQVEQERQPSLDTSPCRRLVLSAAYDNYSAESAAYLRRMGRPTGTAGALDWLMSGPEPACRWSARWMRSEADMDPGRRASALAAHVARIEALERQTREAVQSGTAAEALLKVIEVHLGEARHPGAGDTSGWEAAAMRLDAMLANYGIGTTEDAYVISLWILEARVAAHPDQRTAALEAHAASMSALRDSTLRRLSVGTASANVGFAAAYYASEATAWLDQPPDFMRLE